ncbi:MAG: sugar transferase [Acidimicrobiales bacterium]
MAEPANLRATRTPLAIGDLVLTAFVAVIVTLVTVGTDGFSDGAPILLGLLGSIAVVGTLWWRNAYVVTRAMRWSGDLRLVASSVMYVAVAMVVGSWLLESEPVRVWQTVLTAAWLVALVALRLVLARRAQTTTDPIKVIVAGNTLDALAVRLALRADPRSSYDVQGFVMDRMDDDVPEIVRNLALGSIDHLPHVASRSGADLVVVCLGAMEAERFAPMVRALNLLGIEVALSTGLGRIALRRVNLGHASGRPLVRITPAPLGGWHLRVKGALDVAGAALLLVLTSPLQLLAMIAIRIEDGGRPIFRQVRIGQHGRPFTIFKFRTMVADAEELRIDLTNDHTGPVFKMEGDPRVTRVGKVLRRTSMDELPQLINILKGEMSLVGPRPLPVHEVEAAPASFLDRHTVKPGLTGKWQVSGRSDTGFDQLDELDRWYVDNWSLSEDFEILARTLPAVLLARGAR